MRSGSAAAPVQVVEFTDFQCPYCAKFQVGIADLVQFDACVNDTEPSQRIARSKNLADKMAVRGTPTIFINGWKMPAPPSATDFDRIVRNVADGKSPASGL